MRPCHACRRPLALVAVLALAVPASAATVFGNISRGGKPLPNAPLTLVCAGAEPLAGKSSPDGNYNLSIVASGRCSLKVDETPTVVVLGAEPARYDFEISADGKTLKRR